MYFNSYSNFDAFFSLNWMHRELPVVCQWISSISNGFGDQLNRKIPTKSKSQNMNFHIFHPILMHFFVCKIIIFEGYWWTRKTELTFWNFAYLEGICNTWNSKTRQMSKRQWVRHITVSSKLLCPHLLLKYTWSTFPCRHAAIVLFFALQSTLCYVVF